MKPVRAIFHRKPDRIVTDEVQVEKVIRLSDLMYRHFLAKPCKSYPFLAEQLDKMYVDQAGMRHAVLVMGAEDSGGVLVESEGSSYARYAAYVPYAVMLAYPSLAEFAEILSEVIDTLIEATQGENPEEDRRICLECFQQKCGIQLAENPYLEELLQKMLMEREETQEARFENGQLILKTIEEAQLDMGQLEQQV